MNKRWVQEDENTYILMFTEYYDEIEYGKIVLDDGYWICSSDAISIQGDILLANTLEEAKEEFEEMVASHLREEVSRYYELFKKFKEDI